MLRSFSKLRSGTLPLLRDAVINLPAHHAQRPAVVEDQPVEAQHIPRRNRGGIQHLRAAVHVNLDGRRILQRRGLLGLHRQDGKRVVRGERDAVHRESAAARHSRDRSVDRLRHQRYRRCMRVRAS